MRGGLLKDWTTFEKVWLAVFCALILAATFVFSWTGTDYADAGSILLNWALPLLSAITGIFCVVLCYAEQWWLWILVNVITLVMWALVIVADPASLPWALPTLIMWVAYLVNSVYGLLNWKKGAKLAYV